MKKTTLVLCLTAFFQITNAQIIQLKFTALYNGSYVNIDSVRVSNLTHPADTVLNWPDTTLLLGYVGIPEVGGNALTGFDLRLGSANPCTDQAIIQLTIPAGGDIEIRITDVSGRLVQKISRYLPRGGHSFLYSPGKQGVNFVSATYNSEVRSLKIIYTGKDRGSHTLLYSGLDNMIFGPKSIQSSLSFAYSIGDNLLFRGWYNGNSTDLSDAPQISSSYTFYFVVSNPCPGLPQFTYGGQVYNTVQIGTQCWMRENLNIGTMISGGSDQTNNGNMEKYCYNDDPANCAIYGGLYQWDEMMQYNTTSGTQGICPPGFHIPTDGEWSTLESFLGGSSIAGGKLKETGFAHWTSPNIGATNESGFLALGAGFRNNTGGFSDMQSLASFWSSSEYDATYSWNRYLYSNSANFNQFNNYRTDGYSVRCFKD